MVTAYTSNKKARVVDDPDDDPANGEQSEFFKRKPRKLSVQTPSKSQPVSAKAKQSPLPTTPATTETLHKADPSSNQETPSSLRLLETASPDTDDVDFTSKVTQGWKDHYGLRGGSLQKNPKLSDIIEKQRKASIQRAIPSPRRLGMPSNTGNTGFVERKLRRVCSTPLKKETSGPFISLGDSSGESQEEWPEFVGVGKFSASVSSSQNSSQSSQEAPAIKGLFGRFAFERNR